MTVKLEGIQACVFDAYGTLFNVSSLEHILQEHFGEQAKVVSRSIILVNL